MSEAEQIQHLADDLDKLIDRYCDEYEMTFASAVGVLQMKAWLLCQTAADTQESDEK